MTPNTQGKDVREGDRFVLGTDADGNGCVGKYRRVGHTLLLMHVMSPEDWANTYGVSLPRLRLHSEPSYAGPNLTMLPQTMDDDLRCLVKNDLVVLGVAGG